MFVRLPEAVSPFSNPGAVPVREARGVRGLFIQLVWRWGPCESPETH